MSPVGRGVDSKHSMPNDSGSYDHDCGLLGRSVIVFHFHFRLPLSLHNTQNAAIIGPVVRLASDGFATVKFN